jgi:hypothetical protein
MAEAIQDLPGEIWKPVVGYEGCYSVSSFGRVRSEARRILHPHSGSKSLPTRVIKPGIASSGYPLVVLNKNGKRKSALVHQLVLEAFVGARPEAAEACHVDGDRTNTALANLRWDSRSGNIADARRHGTHFEIQPHRGESHGMAKLTEEQVRDIRQRRAAGESTALIAESLGMNCSHIAGIVAKRRWKHVD